MIAALELGDKRNKSEFREEQESIGNVTKIGDNAHNK